MFFQDLKSQLHIHPKYVAFHAKIEHDPHNHLDGAIVQDLILHKGRIWLPKGFCFIKTHLEEFHSTPSGVHMGITKTLARINDNFTWPGIKEDFRNFILTCVDCQQT